MSNKCYLVIYLMNCEINLYCLYFLRNKEKVKINEKNNYIVIVLFYINFVQDYA